VKIHSAVYAASSIASTTCGLSPASIFSSFDTSGKAILACSEVVSVKGKGGSGGGGWHNHNTPNCFPFSFPVTKVTVASCSDKIEGAPFGK